MKTRFPHALGPAKKTKQLHGHSSSLPNCGCTGQTGGTEDDSPPVMAEETHELADKSTLKQGKMIVLLTLDL
jgi:hypothetical protein